MERNLKAQADAYERLIAELTVVAPQLMQLDGRPGLDIAVTAVRVLAGADPDTDVVTDALALLRSGDAKGRQKYGVTLDDADLSPGELVQHAAEEAADLLKYLVALRRALPAPPEENADTVRANGILLPVEATDAMVESVSGIVSAYAARRIYAQMRDTYLFRKEA